MIVDCHVNIWEERHLTPLFAEQMARIRPGGMGLKADADTLYAAMQGVDKAIVFALRYGDSAGRRERRRDHGGCGPQVSGQVRRLRLRRPAPARLHGAAAPCHRRSRPQGREIRPDLQRRGAGRSAHDPGLRALRRARPAAHHAHGHDVRAQRPGRPRPRHPRRARGAALPRAQDHPRAHGPPLVRGHDRRGAQAAQRLRRDLGDLLPALAVLERDDHGAGVSDHRQDLLRHRLSRSRPSRTRSPASARSTTWSRARACRGSAPR